MQNQKITNNNLNLVKFIQWRCNVKWFNISKMNSLPAYPFHGLFPLLLLLSLLHISLVMPFSIGFVESNSHVILWLLSSSHRLQTATIGISSSSVDNSLNYILHYFPIDYDACEPVGTIPYTDCIKNTRHPDLSCSQISLSSATVSSGLFFINGFDESDFAKITQANLSYFSHLLWVPMRLTSMNE